MKIVTEEDIKHSAGDYFVLAIRGKHTRYEVCKNGFVHATVDSAYPLNEDGLSIATARCNYLAKRSQMENV